MPRTGKPAIDAGINPLGLAFDQRGEGFTRDHRGVDIGAFEVQTDVATDSIFRNGFDP